jgi:hypothetical protein
MDGIGRRTNVQSTRTFAALWRYKITTSFEAVIEHFPAAIAAALSNGIKPFPAHTNRMLKKASKLIVQEKIIIA